HEPRALVDVVVKIGGSLIAHPEHLTAVLAIVHEAARRTKLVIVPGGGPFADVVRDVDRALGLSDDAAHWMAVLGMEQCAHLITSRLEGGVLVSDPDGIRRALDLAHVPVLAPSRWLQETDPLPHSWDVTSDSIAAWVAGMTGARRLVLVKAPGAGPSNLVDAYFDQVRALNIETVIVTADDVAGLRTALRNPTWSPDAGSDPPTI
ncbi:MAG: hypothetical protein HOP16_09825, partial [Acidobacteria bacterium]|nr:hypothetical protein [Acidobacteriota bacterium]